MLISQSWIQVSNCFVFLLWIWWNLKMTSFSLFIKQSSILLTLISSLMIALLLIFDPTFSKCMKISPKQKSLPKFTIKIKIPTSKTSVSWIFIKKMRSSIDTYTKILRSSNINKKINFHSLHWGSSMIFKRIKQGCRIEI